VFGKGWDSVGEVPEGPAAGVPLVVLGTAGPGVVVGVERGDGVTAVPPADRDSPTADAPAGPRPVVLPIVAGGVVLAGVLAALVGVVAVAVEDAEPEVVFCVGVARMLAVPIAGPVPEGVTEPVDCVAVGGDCEKLLEPSAPPV
jgi:hypothetical protein